MKKVVFVAALFLSGCATSYQPESFSGGFSDVRLSENTFRVAMRGNGYSRSDRVEEMALLRSSELALQHGFKYFVIVNGSNSEKTAYVQQPTYASTTTTGLGTSSLQSNTIVTGGNVYKVSKPSTSNTIVCLNEQPKDVFSYNAQMVFDSLSKKYKK